MAIGIVLPTAEEKKKSIAAVEHCGEGAELRCFRGSCGVKPQSTYWLVSGSPTVSCRPLVISNSAHELGPNPRSLLKCMAAKLPLSLALSRCSGSCEGPAVQVGRKSLDVLPRRLHWALPWGRLGVDYSSHDLC